MEKSKQKPREGHAPRGGWKRKPSLRIRNDGRSSYCVKNTAIPPLGNPTPPAMAELLVNGENTKPPPVIIECEMLPLGTFPASVREAPLMTVTIGLNGQAALQPAQKIPVRARRSVPMKPWPDCALQV